MARAAAVEGTTVDVRDDADSLGLPRDEQGR
jgi:hypothetical protein